MQDLGDKCSDRFSTLMSKEWGLSSKFIEADRFLLWSIGLSRIRHVSISYNLFRVSCHWSWRWDACSVAQSFIQGGITPWNCLLKLGVRCSLSFDISGTTLTASHVCSCTCMHRHTHTHRGRDVMGIWTEIIFCDLKSVSRLQNLLHHW